MVVIFEVDAYLPEAAQGAETGVDGLVDILSDLNLDSDTSSADAPDPSAEPSAAGNDDYGLKIIRAGKHVPQDSLVELTAKKKMIWSEDYPQLYLSGTPHHFFAVHDGDTFTAIKRRHMADPEMQWHDATFQPGFRRLPGGRGERPVRTRGPPGACRRIV